MKKNQRQKNARLLGVFLSFKKTGVDVFTGPVLRCKQSLSQTKKLSVGYL
jgi:hypothetical protein